MIKVFVSDMDNTLYPWVDFIVPALEAMVSNLEETTGFPRIEIIQSLKAVYDKYGSNEYPFAIQESAIFQRFSYDFMSFNKVIIEPARKAFSQTRRKYQSFYPGVEKTLAELRGKVGKMALLTDAPRNAAEGRVKQFELERFFDALYCMPGYPLPEGRVDPEIAERDKRGEYKAKGIKVIELERHWQKPSVEGLKKIIADYGVKPEEVLVVGDNLQKDIALAQRVGCIDVWAEYGTYIPLEYRERLEVISSGEELKRNMVSDELLEAIKPNYRISNFELLLDFINLQESDAER
ncbi:MAG: hypothetical protein Kow0090_22440 [Myxococcota bacterium]